MQSHIIKALKSVASLQQKDNLHYLQNLKNYLLQILRSLSQQIKLLQQKHQDQINQLYSIISQKQQLICQLKNQDNFKSIQQHHQHQLYTPYKMLLKQQTNKSNQNQQLLNYNKIQKQTTFSIQKPAAYQNKRFSLQIINPRIQKKQNKQNNNSCYFPTKLSNKLKNNNPILINRDFIQQNIQIISNYSSSNSNNSNNIKQVQKKYKQKCYTARCRIGSRLSHDVDHYHKNSCVSGNKLQTIQSKQPVILQKVDIKNPKSVFQKKKQPPVFQAVKNKYGTQKISNKNIKNVYIKTR